jgi:phosphatidylserine decarboxylase
MRSSAAPLWKSRHQYVDRRTATVRTEPLFKDAVVAWLYTPLWEHGPALYALLTGRRSSQLLGFLLYDALLDTRTAAMRRQLAACGVDLNECVELPERLDTPRKLFERQIQYWRCRPMPPDPGAIVAPADARTLIGSLRETSSLFLKGKFFDLEELLGVGCRWSRAFQGADYSVHRLTPEKYHHNHVPVAGRVADVYDIAGRYHACNPGAVVTVMTPHSKNRRSVTILDTDLPGGTGVGFVAMIEVAALMVGAVVQCYSTEGYREPAPIQTGMFLERGAVKSRFQPGGSTVLLLFQPGRVRFASDLLANRVRPDVETRFSLGFGRPLVETDLLVRSLLARRHEAAASVQETSHGE